MAEASAWYELREPGLGARFEQELRDTLLRVADRPLSFPQIEGDIRRARLHVFPYLVVFRMHSAFIEIAGVVHGARHPSVQRRRGRRR